MHYPERHAAGTPRLCFVSYRQIREFAAPVLVEYADRAHIDVVDGTFEEALRIAQQRAGQGLVDVFVSAGSNASILRAGLQTPVATIQLGGFDLLQALIRARAIADRVGVVTYGQTLHALDDVKALLNIEIIQHAYHTPDDARARVEQLRQDGFRVIVGSSLVVDLAEQAGLHGLLAYSLSSIRRAFDDAIELARVARLESGRYDQLNSVLHNLQDAVLAVDQEHRIIAANTPMRRLLGHTTASAPGMPLDAAPPELSLRATLETGAEERAVVLRFADRDWIANRTPIRENNQIVGAAITLYDARAIQEADSSLRRQQRRSQKTARYEFTSLIGHSPVFRQSLDTARRFAKTDLTVLISGESGVGKELFAQAIHSAGARAERPFVAVNCAAFPESLLESELFGYEDGAFTGSRRGGKRGLIEAAHTGTLFLDEIGDMPLPLQSRLLRVLQEREITRLGATSAIAVDVRVVVATHQPLQQLIAERRFRQDLYYRINTLRLRLPPLRERGPDILDLAQALLARCLQRHGCALDAAAALAPLADRLRTYAWPGNVRELENIVERIAIWMLPAGRVNDIPYAALQQDCPELFETAAPGLPVSARREQIMAAMERAGGQRNQAAQHLGVSRSTLWRWLRELEAQPPTMAQGAEAAP
ncbi:propionate catabolism operon regulatory protein PrpR [Comamonadaceae bacterium G21597-S1]|nr:propionate catabolism operon regulatory protein PrpR [Comamonadaceae bacterium G21597-S1]